MRKVVFGIALLWFLALKGETCTAQNIAVIKIKEVLSRINQTSDSLLVINFWATWCKPCVAELPAFIQAEKYFENKPVSFVYVSLDFKKNLQTGLQDFIQKNAFNSEVVLLDEPDYNSWIDLISKDWGGAIPATLIVDRKHHQQTFHEGPLLFNELTNLINKYLP